MKFARRKTSPFQNTSNFIKFGSSRPEVFCKKGVLRNLTKFTEKHQYQSLSLNKVAGQACNFNKKRLWCRLFRRLFIHKFCNNSKMLLSLSWAMFMERLCFRFYQGPTFLRLSTCVFPFY